MLTNIVQQHSIYAWLFNPCINSKERKGAKVLKKRKLIAMLLAVSMMIGLFPVFAIEMEFSDTTTEVGQEERREWYNGTIGREVEYGDGARFYLPEDEEEVNPEVAAHRALAAEALIEMYGYTKEEIDRAAYFHGNINDFMRELYNFDNTKEYIELDEDTQSDILLLIANGYTNSQAMSAIISGDILNVSVADLAMLKAEEIEAEYEKVRHQRVKFPEPVQEEEQDGDILLLSIKFGVPYSVVEDYLEQNSRVDIVEAN